MTISSLQIVRLLTWWNKSYIKETVVGLREIQCVYVFFWTGDPEAFLQGPTPPPPHFPSKKWVQPQF